MNYWLFKSEPDEYNLDDLAAEPSGSGRWDGIRNYQARNILRDEVNVGDLVLFYYSSCKLPGAAGIAKVTRSAYPDPAQFDANSPYYDAKAVPDNPRWYCVDIAFKEKFQQVISLKSLKEITELSEMVLLKQGRLSIQPVRKTEWQSIMAIAKNFKNK